MVSPNSEETSLSTATAASGPRPRATIRDVAALAQVGIKTVSRVINDEANVSAQTRERVERAIRALNFQPHQGAASLRETAVFAASFDDDAERERRLVDAFTRRRVDGLILTTYNSDVGYLQR